MRSAPKVVVLAIALTALSGCQSFPLTSWIFKRSDHGSRELRPGDGSTAFADGRKALEGGRPGAAIVFLQDALIDPSTRAPASNAMGVAYAQIGRDDLAERYFKSAIAADPSDQRFVANLLRLQHAVLVRKAQSDATRLAAQQPQQRASAAGFVAEGSQPRASTAHLSAQIERRSRGEVFIASGKAASAPTATVAYSVQSKSEAARDHADGEADRPPAPLAAQPMSRILDNPFAASPAPAPTSSDES